MEKPHTGESHCFPLFQMCWGCSQREHAPPPGWGGEKCRKDLPAEMQLPLG